MPAQSLTRFWPVLNQSDWASITCSHGFSLIMWKSLLGSTEDTWCWITCLATGVGRAKNPVHPGQVSRTFSSFSKMPFLKLSLWIKKSNARTQSKSLLLEEAMRGELNELHICCSHYTGHMLAYKLLQICPPFPSNLLLYCLAIEMVKLSTLWLKVVV